MGRRQIDSKNNTKQISFSRCCICKSNLGIVNLDEVDTINQFIPLSEIRLSGFHSIHIFAYFSKQNNLFNELLVKVNFWIFVFSEPIFFEKNPNYSSLNINLKIAESFMNSGNPEILGIRNIWESGNSGNPDILGIRKFWESRNSWNQEILKTRKDRIKGFN